MENTPMNVRLGIVALLFVLVLPFAMSATAADEEIALENCEFTSASDLACSQTTTATCEAKLTGLGDVVINDVEYTISGTIYGATLTSGNRTDGTWQVDVEANARNKQDFSFERASVEISGQTSDGTSSCSASGGNANTGRTPDCLVTWGSTTSVTNTCSCTYTTTSGDADENDVATFTRTPSEGCIDQSETVWQQSKDFCDPQWTASYSACVDGKQTKTYTAADDECRQNGNDIWFRHNTGSDQTPPIDEGTTRSCTITPLEQVQVDERNTGEFTEEVSLFNVDENARRSASFSTNFQPYSADVDDDGLVELVTFGVSNIRMYNHELEAHATQNVGGTISGSPALIRKDGSGGDHVLLVPVRLNASAGQLQMYSVDSSSFSLEDTIDFDGTGVGSGVPEGIPRGVSCEYGLSLATDTTCYLATSPAGSNPYSYAHKVSVSSSITLLTSNEISAFLTGTSIFTGSDWDTITNLQSTDASPAIVQVSEGDTQVLWPMISTQSGIDRGTVFVTTEDLERRQKFSLSSRSSLTNNFNQGRYELIGQPVVDEARKRAYISFEEEYNESGQERLELGAYSMSLLEEDQYVVDTSGAAITSRSPVQVWINTKSLDDEGASNMVLLDGVNPAFTISTQRSSLASQQEFNIPTSLQVATAGNLLWHAEQDDGADTNAAGYGAVTADGRYLYVLDFERSTTIDGEAYLRQYDMLLGQEVDSHFIRNIDDNSAEDVNGMVYDPVNEEVYLYFDTFDVDNGFTTEDFVLVDVSDRSGMNVITDDPNPGNFDDGMTPAGTVDGVRTFIGADSTSVSSSPGFASYNFSLYEWDDSSGAFSSLGMDAVIEDVPNGENRIGSRFIVADVDFESRDGIYLTHNHIFHPNSSEGLYYGNALTPGAFNYDFSDPRVMLADGSKAKITDNGVGSGFSVTTTATSCENFMPLYYNADSHVLGIVTEVGPNGTVDTLNPQNGPVIGYCDFSDELNPQVFTYDLRVPYNGVSNSSGTYTYTLNPRRIQMYADDNSFDGSADEYTIVIAQPNYNEYSNTAHDEQMKAVTLRVDEERVAATSSSGGATRTVFFGSNLEGSNSVYAEYSKKSFISSGDFDGDGNADVLTPIGAFLHYTGSTSSQVGPTLPGPGTGEFVDFDTGANGVRDAVYPFDANSDGFMDLVTVLPGQAFFTTYTTSPPADATLEGSLQINSFDCSVRPNSNTVDARLLATAPDPDSMRVQFRKGDGKGTRTVDTALDGLYTLRFDNSGEYTITAIVDFEEEATCSVNIPETAAPSGTCDIGMDGEFDYTDMLRNRGWDINRGSEDIRPSGGTYVSTINDVEYSLQGCDASEVTVEFGVYPGRDGGVYINGVNGGTAGMKFVDSDNAVLNEGNENLDTYPTQGKVDVRFVIDVMNSQIRYYLGDEHMYSQEINDFRLDSVQIDGRIALDYVRVTTSGQSLDAGETVQTPDDLLEGDSTLLNGCDAEAMQEEENISERMASPNVRAYCSSVGGCSMNELRNVINANNACSKEAYNYCITSSASQNTGIAQGTQCATLLAAGSALNQIGFPVVSGIWDIITQNFLASMLILIIAVVTIPIWVKRRRK